MQTQTQYTILSSTISMICSVLPMAVMLLAALVLPRTVQGADDTTEPASRVLIVVTNHGTLGPAGTDAKATGYWLAEVAHPWAEFRDAGITVDFASPAGGFVPMDPRSFDLDDEINRRFWEDLATVEALLDSHNLATVDMDRYDAVYFAGGHGTMWDFPDNDVVQRAVRTVWTNGGIIGAVCHGPAALIGVRVQDDTALVAGKRVTAFTVEEEQAVELTDVVPFLLTERLEESGARVITGDAFQEQVVVDGRLVTGQNPASAGPAAARMVELLQQ